MTSNVPELVAKANSFYKLLAVTFAVAVNALPVLGMYQAFVETQESFISWIMLRLINPWYWVLPILGSIWILNTFFRRIEFNFDHILVRRWYWKDSYYLYPDVASVELDDYERTLTIKFKNRKSVKIPEYLLQIPQDDEPLGSEIIVVLRSKCGYLLPVR